MPHTAWTTTATATTFSPCKAPAQALPEACPMAGAPAAGGEGEPDPGGEGPRQPGAEQPDRHSHLAAGRTGEELAEGHQIGVGALVQPAPADDVLGVKVADTLGGAGRRSYASR